MRFWNGLKDLAFRRKFISPPNLRFVRVPPLYPNLGVGRRPNGPRDRDSVDCKSMNYWIAPRA